jgi:hypothetical protein
MRDLIFIFHNTREAIMGERRLLDSNLAARVMPVPGTLGKVCGIALRVPEAEADKALRVLGENYLGVFYKEGGEFVPWNIKRMV